MKSKFLYVAMLLICMGLFTSAKQTSCICMADLIGKTISKKHTVKQKADKDKTFDLSPLRHFIFISTISN